MDNTRNRTEYHFRTYNKSYANNIILDNETDSLKFNIYKILRMTIRSHRKDNEP